VWWPSSAHNAEAEKIFFFTDMMPRMWALLTTDSKGGRNVCIMSASETGAS
jgi:hypothetical protein